jgi:hypothetical protein
MIKNYNYAKRKKQINPWIAAAQPPA